MGFLSKLKKKSIGHKLVGKAIKNDPLASKLVKHDPLMQKATGLDKRSSGGPRMTVKQALTNKLENKTAARPAVRTGGNAPTTPTATNRLSKLGSMNRPARRGRIAP